MFPYILGQNLKKLTFFTSILCTFIRIFFFFYSSPPLLAICNKKLIIIILSNHPPTWPDRFPLNFLFFGQRCLYKIKQRYGIPSWKAQKIPLRRKLFLWTTTTRSLNLDKFICSWCNNTTKIAVGQKVSRDKKTAALSTTLSYLWAFSTWHVAGISEKHLTIFIYFNFNLIKTTRKGGVTVKRLVIIEKPFRYFQIIVISYFLVCICNSWRGKMIFL